MDPIRVMIVDDSVVVRKVVSEALSADAAVDVVGTAVNAKLGLAKLDKLRPDVVLMDMHMPEMNGIEAVRAVRARRPDLPIIMLCALTPGGAAAALEAMTAGANDYVTKPADLERALEAVSTLRTELLPRIKALTGRSTEGAAAPRPDPRRAGHPAALGVPRKLPALLVIAASTGGPEALATLLPELPASLPVPVLVVQHMPPVFTRQFAERLDRLCALDVREAAQGAPLQPGVVQVAPGDFHMTVRSVGRRREVALDQEPPENFCRPSADRLFLSASAAFDGAVLSVVLTGMGSDGRAGAARIRGAGGTVLVQDRASSVVWGMPGVIAEAGLADDVVPLRGMAHAICRRLPQHRGTAALLPRVAGGA